MLEVRLAKGGCQHQRYIQADREREGSTLYMLGPEIFCGSVVGLHMVMSRKACYEGKKTYQATPLCEWQNPYIISIKGTYTFIGADYHAKINIIR